MALSDPVEQSVLDPAGDKHGPRQWLLAFVAVLGIWTFAGLLFATEMKFAYEGGSNPLYLPWRFFLIWKMSTALSWALVTPVILLAARKWSFERGARLRSVLCHLALFAAIAPVQSMLDGFFSHLARVLFEGRELSYVWHFGPGVFLESLPVAPFYYTVIAGLGYAMDYYRKSRDRAVALSLARLETLRSQLNPHFLFNTLNAIGALCWEDPKAANHVLALLAGLMRRSLDGTSRQEIPLRDEVEFVKDYVEIEQLMLSERLGVAYDLAQDTLDLLVPTFVLQPLVENAIKHGIAPRSARGHIALQSRVTRDTLELKVEDDGVGLGPGGLSKEGRGLSLTRERLRTMYGSLAALEIANRPESGLVATLRVPVRKGSEPTRRESAP